MSDAIYDLLSSVDTPYFSNAEGTPRLAERIEVHRFDFRPQIEGARVAILGIQDGRRSGDNEGCATAPNAIREALYRLTPPRNWQHTIDLGDLRPGITEQDTAAAVRSLVGELIEMGVIPLVLGGGQDLTYPLYQALEPLGQAVNLVTIDSRLDFGADPEDMTSKNFLNNVILHEPNYLFHYSNIGHQGYQTDPDTLDLLEQMQFDAHRLGKAHEDIRQLEPVLRDADLVSFDMGAIRAADHPAHDQAGPNGLDALQSCALARYAGQSDRVKCFGLFEHNPDLDLRNLGAQLAGQIVWHFLDGVYNQVADFPKCDKSEYTRYVVDLPNIDHEVVFLKSGRSDRWWMDIPYPPTNKQHAERTLTVPCTYATYEEAAQGDLPDAWWRMFQKLA